jgi:hypothetical protein
MIVIYIKTMPSLEAEISKAMNCYGTKCQQVSANFRNQVFSSHRAIEENTKGLAVVKEELAVIKKMLARMAAAQGVNISDLV